MSMQIRLHEWKRVSLFCSKDCACISDGCINMKSISGDDTDDGLDL